MPAAPLQRSLGASARAALLWGGGFTLLRDVAQFALMLILVRLLNPADYGTAAFVQSIVGFLSMISYSTFSLHALQIRDPETIDWQAHFSIATVLNGSVFCIVLLSAYGLSFTVTYRDVAWPLAALGAGFLIEIPGTMRARMLEANHEWKRFRLQLGIGTLLGMSVGLTVALLGGGVWALILQPPMLGLPAAFDLLVLARFRPDFTWSWDRYRETIWFGLNRVSSGTVGRARSLNENMLLSSIFDLATLGFFTRANGLGNLLAGRIGSIAMTSLYPVVTRAERGSQRFRRLSTLALRGVCWATAPAVIFLSVAAHDIVLLLYGAKWQNVIPLLPLAAVASGTIGIWNALALLLLANEDTRAALLLDVVAALSAIALAFLLVPYGAIAYLGGLAVHAAIFVGITAVVLLKRRATSIAGVAVAIFPAIGGSLSGALAVVGLRACIGADLTLPLRILLEGATVGLTYLLTLRIFFAIPLAELLSVVPGGRTLARGLLLSSDIFENDA